MNDGVRERLRQAFACGRPANGYILVGDIREEGRALAEWIGRELLGDLPTIAEHAHPDMPWFEPVKTSRIIDAEMMRLQILPFLQQTALSGGWKIAVIVSADRMNATAANAFLKTLEEPGEKTLSLLLAESLSDFLPTIISRCQVIHVGGTRQLAEPWRTQALELLASAQTKGVWEATCMAEQLCAMLDEMSEAAKGEVRKRLGENTAIDTDNDTFLAMVSARARGWRSELLLILEQWMQDLVRLRSGGEAVALHFPDYRTALIAQSQRYPLAKLLENLTNLDTLQVQLERNIAPAHLLPYWMDRFYL